MGNLINSNDRERQEIICLMMLEKLTGTISQEDCRLLDQLIDTDARVRMEWEDMSNGFSEAQSMDFLESYKDGSFKLLLHDNLVRSKAKAKRQMLLRNAGLLLLVAGLLVSGAWYFRSIEKTEATSGLPLPIKKGLKLQLYNGSTIDLSAEDNANRINTAGIEFNNNTASRRLSYKTGNGVAAKTNLLSVPAGMDYHLALSDGSEIFLNSASAIVFPFSFKGHDREISIKGEAYLKIAANPGSPFIVHLPNADIVVLGTEFNVNAYDSANIKISLRSGLIRLRAFDREMAIEPGSQVQLSSGRHALETKKIPPADLSWIEGKYILDNTPLKELTAVIPRWFGIAVELDNENIGDRHFTGIINKNLPLENFLEYLKSAANCSYYFRDGVLHLY